MSDAASSRAAQLWYGSLYFFCSASMLLFNKLAINAYPVPGLILTIQYAFCVAAVWILSGLGLVTTDPLQWSIIKKYYPVPALFACAVFANNKILQYANIETFIVVRNTTPLFVATIEFFLMGKTLPSVRSLLCFVLIIFGAVLYGMTDKGFRLESYLWALIYLTVFCSEMVFVKHIFNSVKMTTWGRMLYTNLLSIPFQPFFIISTQEYTWYSDPEMVLTTSAVVYIFLSCIGGFGISFAGIGFRSRVSATTFTLIGVVNKVITIAINFLMWDKHANPIGLFSLGLCLIGSTLYQPSGYREKGPGGNATEISNRVWSCFNTASMGCCERSQLERDDNRARASGSIAPAASESTKIDDKEDPEKEQLLHESASARSQASVSAPAPQPVFKDIELNLNEHGTKRDTIASRHSSPSSKDD